MVGGPETAAFKGALGAGGTSARGGSLPDGHAVPGRVFLSGPMKSERGSRGCSNHRGRGCHLVLAKVLGSGCTAREAAGNRGGLSLRGPALPAPLGGSDQGVPRAGWAQTRRPEQWAGRIPSPQPTPSSSAGTGPRLTRLAEAGSRRSCSAGGSARPGQPAGGSSTPLPPRPAPLCPSRTLSTGND